MSDGLPSPTQSLVDRVGSLAARLRSRHSPASERAVLGLAVVGFVVAFIVGWRALPNLREGTRWELIALVGLVGVPLTAIANGAEYAVTARLEGHRVTLRESTAVSVAATAANLLPLPGAVMIRARALRRRGTSYGRAFYATALVGVVFVGVTALVAGAFQLGTGKAVLAAALLATGAAVSAAAWLLIRAHAGSTLAWDVMWRAVAVEVASVAIGAMRLFVVVHAVGLEITASQAFALMIGAVLAAAVGFFPAGLGLRELLSSAIAPLVELPAAVGLVATAVDRVVGLAVLPLLALTLLMRAPQEGTTSGPPADVHDS